MSPKAMISKKLFAQEQCIQRLQQSRDSPSFFRSLQENWKEGEIAFMKPWNLFTQQDTEGLIDTGYLDAGATGHPVIILRRHSMDSTHVMVTLVSSFGSGRHNNFLAPWRQSKYSWVAPNYIRSFKGSPRYDAQKNHLNLKDGRNMPKYTTSWVNIQNVWVVPISVLQNFDKSDVRLCMTTESLADLRRDISANTWDIKHILADSRLKLKSSPITGARVPNMPLQAPQSVRKQFIATSTSNISNGASQKSSGATTSSTFAQALSTPWRSIRPAISSQDFPSGKACVTSIKDINAPWRPLEPVISAH
jgi:hypothetical protein